MNKIFPVTIIILLAVVAIGAVFYWKNFRGSGPAFTEPVQNIADILPASSQTPQTENLKTGENKTDFPLQVPAGFSISIFAKNLPDARVMAIDELGNMWVSRPASGVVTNLEVRNGVVTNQSNILRDLNYPHGLALDPESGTSLYIGEENRISQIYLYTEGEYTKIADLPASGRHTTRSLLFGTDGRLYVHIGSSCDTCVESDQRRGSIYSLNKDGSDFKEFALGLRNSVFMANHPVTGEIWATEMGRDFLGDNLPPDEVNIVREGKFYGWPYCYGNKIQDRSFDPSDRARRFCESSEPSKIDIQAHSAPLELAFFPESPSWPKEYWNNLLVAYHGSWNRSTPTGYKIVRYKLDREGNLLGQEDFITGWLADGSAFGRPVDIKIQPDGNIYISDDKAGVIYLVEYRR